MTAPLIAFIGGSGRSGTNVTKALLGRHPDVHTLPFEHRFLLDPDGLIDFYASFAASWSPFLADRRLKRLESLLRRMAHEPWLHRAVGDRLRRWNPDGRRLAPRQYHGWQLRRHFPNYDSHVDRLMAELIEFRSSVAWVGTESYAVRAEALYRGPSTRADLAAVLGRFVRATTADMLGAAGRRVFVEDNTYNILFAREILDLVPDARIVHVYRDPRDVIASFLKQRWCPDDVVQAATWYRDIMNRWLAVRDTLPAAAVFEFALEDLVADRDALTQRLCGALGLPPAPAMGEVDLARANRGRWRQELAPADVSRLTEIVGPLLERYGAAA